MKCTWLQNSVIVRLPIHLSNKNISLIYVSHHLVNTIMYVGLWEQTNTHNTNRHQSYVGLIRAKEFSKSHLWIILVYRNEVIAYQRLTKIWTLLKDPSRHKTGKESKFEISQVPPNIRTHTMKWNQTILIVLQFNLRYKSR